MPYDILHQNPTGNLTNRHKFYLKLTTHSLSVFLKGFHAGRGSASKGFDTSHCFTLSSHLLCYLLLGHASPFSSLNKFIIILKLLFQSIVLFTELRIFHPSVSHLFKCLHDFTSFILALALSSSRCGVFCVFFIKLLRITTFFQRPSITHSPILRVFASNPTPTKSTSRPSASHAQAHP